MLIIKIRNKEVDTLRKAGLQNLTLTDHIEDKRNKGKLLFYLQSLSKWEAKQSLRGRVKWRTLLRAKNDRMLE